MKGLVTVIHLLSLALVYNQKPETREMFDPTFVMNICALSVFNIIVFLTTTSRYFAFSLRYDVLFLLTFIIVHFQFPYFETIGIPPERPDFIWINKNVVNYGVWLSAMSILIWMIGYLINLGRSKEIITRVKMPHKGLKALDIFLYTLFAVFLYTVGDEFLSGKYDGVENWGIVSIYVFLLFQSGLILRLIYTFSNATASPQPVTIRSFFNKNLVFFLLVLLVVLIFLRAGDRGILMDIGLISMASVAYFIRPIKLYQILILMVAGAIFFSIIGLGRSSKSDPSDHLLKSGVEKIEESDNFNPTEELASSNRILFRAIDKVPDPHPYLMGSTMAFELVSMVPFGGSALFSIIEVPVIYQSSSVFFTVLGQGIHYTWGEGTEVLADIYINFGQWGVFVMMFLHGMVIAYFSYRGLKKGPVAIIVSLLLISNAIYINRSTMLLIFKSIFYVLLINFFFVTLFNRKDDTKTIAIKAEN